MTFATVEDLATWMGQGSLDAHRAQRFLDAATAEIQGYTHQELSLHTDDDYTVNWWEQDEDVALPQLPVVSIGSVTIGEGPALDPAWYDFDSVTGRIWRVWGSNQEEPPGWWGWSAWPYQPVYIVYTHGYDPLPQDIVGVCLDVAARALTAGAGSEFAPPAQAVGFQSTVGLMRQEQERMDRYRRRVRSISTA